MPTNTTTYSFQKPVVGADEDSWGGYLNSNWDKVDDLFDGTSAITGIDINSGTIDGTVIGGSSAAAITGTTITGTSFVSSGDMTFGDNDKAIFGAGSDLQIYHDGGNSIIEDTATGKLIIKGTDLDLKATDATKYMQAVDGGAVTLYYADATNGAKLSTTSTGVDITGTLTSDGLTVDGSTPSISNGTSPAAFTIGASNGASSNLILKGAAGMEMQTYNGGWKKYFNLAYTGDISFYEDTGTTAKFFWDASAESLGIGNTTPSSYNDGSDNLVIGSGGSNGISIHAGVGMLHFTNVADTTERVSIKSTVASNTLEFTTAGTERMRIDSSGNVGIGTSSPASFFSGGNQLVVGDGSGAQGLTIYAESTNHGQILFADGTTGNEAYRGILRYDHVTDSMQIMTAGATERMRIDSSGNLLVGGTSAGGSSTFTAYADGQIHAYRGTATGRAATFTATTSEVGYFNRLSTDGDIVQFAKDGTTVGSIGVNNLAYPYFINPASGGAGIACGTGSAVVPVDNTGAFANGTKDIGTSSVKFKDLYLSGGVYLGGTGAANYLDDYEEGTWTVALTPSTSGTISLDAGGGAFYTKIGQVVHISISVGNNSSSSPVGYIGFNLPFAAASGFQKGRSALALYFDGVAGSNVADFVGLTIDGTSEGRIYLGDNPVTQSDSAQQMDGSCYILISGSYITSA